MNFLDPIDFSDALKDAQDRSILPTDLGSAQISAWNQELKRRSVFTARGTNAEFLQMIKDVVDGLEAGAINQAKARELLHGTLETLEYSAEHGFPGDAELGIPPAERDSLQDLMGEDRLNLILDTQARQVANFAYNAQGQTPFALHAWPCWELIRVAWRRVPRGMRTSKGMLIPDPDNAWPARWEKVGGQLFEGRMIARKDSTIWEALGDPMIFRDGLGQPYPPFAFNSGYGVREVSRAEAIAHGVIRANNQVKSHTRPLNEGAKLSVRNLDDEFLKALKADLDIEVKAGEARLRDELAEAKRAYLGAANEAWIEAWNAFNPGQLRDALGRWEAVEGAAIQPLNAAECASMKDLVSTYEREIAQAKALYARHGLMPPATIKEVDQVPQHVIDEWAKLTGEHFGRPPDPQFLAHMHAEAKSVLDSNDAVRYLHFVEAKHSLHTARYLPLTGAERAAYETGGADTRAKLAGNAWKRMSARRMHLAKAGAIQPEGHGAANEVSAFLLDLMIEREEAA